MNLDELMNNNPPVNTWSEKEIIFDLWYEYGNKLISEHKVDQRYEILINKWREHIAKQLSQTESKDFYKESNRFLQDLKETKNKLHNHGKDITQKYLNRILRSFEYSFN